jgi:hypothetical protein
MLWHSSTHLLQKAFALKCSSDSLLFVSRSFKSFQELLCTEQDSECFWFTIARRLLREKLQLCLQMEQVLVLLLLSITLF